MLLALAPLLVFLLLRWVAGNAAVPALAHAVAVVLVAATQVPFLLRDDVAGASGWGEACAAITGQYMLYDLVHVTHWSYCVHHGLAILASAYVLYTKRFLTLVLFLEVNEVSTIFMHTRTLGPWPRLSRWLFVVSFVLCRPVWLTWLLWRKPIDDALLGAMLRLHYVVNGYWCGKIAQQVARHTRRSQ